MDEDSVAIVNVNQVMPEEVVAPPNAQRGGGAARGRGRGKSSRGKGRGGATGQDALAQRDPNAASETNDATAKPTDDDGERKAAASATAARAGVSPQRLVDKARSGRGLGAGRQRGRGKGL